MIRLVIPSLLLVVVAVPAWGDFLDGLEAYRRGDYTVALREWEQSARRGDARARLNLGVMIEHGLGAPADTVIGVGWYIAAAESPGFVQAVIWYERAAQNGDPLARYVVGRLYRTGNGVRANSAEAVKWYLLAADQGFAPAEHDLAVMYDEGEGVPQDDDQAVRWYRRAASQGVAGAQSRFGRLYVTGRGVAKDLVVAHAWFNLASSRTASYTRNAIVKDRDDLARLLTPEQMAAAQRLAREWKPGQDLLSLTPVPPRADPAAPAPRAPSTPEVASTGTGFIISGRGHILTADHVVESCREVRAVLPAARREAMTTRVIARDPKNDLAVVQAATAPPTSTVAAFRDGRGIRAGDGIVAVGFPLRGLLASAANVTTGAVSALAGLGDDTRYLQITAPVQAGNSGGPLLDQGGNVVGVVVSKLDALKVLQATGDLPQNVNFAIHASVARTFLDANRVEYETAPSTRTLSAADVGERAKAFTVVVECWK